MGYISATIRVTLIEALRSRLFAIAVLGMLVAIGAALFLGELALTEATQVQVTIVAAVLRLCAVFLLIAFIVSSVTREFHDQLVVVVLAQAVPRWQYIAGKLSGFICVGCALALLMAVPIALFAPIERVAFWTISLACELVIVAAASLFCALTLTQFVAGFAAVSAFYLLARSLDAMQILSGSLASQPTWSDRVLSGFVALLASVLPHIDRMTQTAWLIETPLALSLLGPTVAQSGIYLVLLGAAALFDFYRQNF